MSRDSEPGQSVVTCAVVRINNKGLVTNYGEGGGLQNGRGGHVKFYSYEKGGRKKF